MEPSTEPRMLPLVILFVFASVFQAASPYVPPLFWLGGFWACTVPWAREDFLLMLFYHLSTAFFAVAFATAAPTRLENPKLKLPYQGENQT